MYAIRSYYVEVDRALFLLLVAGEDPAAAATTGFALAWFSSGPGAAAVTAWAGHRITSYNVCYTKLLRGGDGEGRHIIHPRQARAPGRCGIAGEQGAVHGVAPAASFCWACSSSYNFV